MGVAARIKIGGVLILLSKGPVQECGTPHKLKSAYITDKISLINHQFAHTISHGKLSIKWAHFYST